MTELEAARAEVLELKARVEAVSRVKDGAYSERNKLVAALSKLFPASLERHEGQNWEEDWRWVVFVDLPAGQVSWHLHDSEVPQFGHLPRKQGRKWDGHSTEEKYQRLAALPQAPAADLTPEQQADVDSAWRKMVGADPTGHDASECPGPGCHEPQAPSAPKECVTLGGDGPDICPGCGKRSALTESPKPQERPEAKP